MAGKMVLNIGRLFANSFTSFRSVPQRGIKRYVRNVSIELRKRQKEYLSNMTEEELNEMSRRSNFIEWNYSAEIFAFGKRLHEEFTPELLVQAFTHRSYIEKEKMKQIELGISDPEVNLKDNDDLASEGESIINDYCGRYVSHFFPRLPLEAIKCIVNHLNSEKLLAHVSKNLGTTFLILSGDYPVETSTYAKTLRAIIGALKRCQGLKRSEFFVRDLIITQLSGKDVNEFLLIENKLQVLSEILKKDGRGPPEPRIIFQSGMKTVLANYHVGIYSDKCLIGHCSGESVNIAIEMAAFDALKRLFHTTDSCSPISYDLTDAPTEISNLELSNWSLSAFEKKSEHNL